MRPISGFALVLMLLTTVACQPTQEPAAQQDDVAADIEAIHAVRDAYIAAETAGDAAAVAALYAEDAVLMPANEPAVSGRAGIQEHLQRDYATMTAELTATSRETKVAGDIAYDAGTHTIRLTPKAGGNVIEGTGKQIVTLARQTDGSWKITNLIFNMDAPMPMPPPSR